MSQVVQIPLDLIKIIAFYATINTKLAMICTCKKWYEGLNRDYLVWFVELRLCRDLPSNLKDCNFVLIKRIYRDCRRFLSMSPWYRGYVYFPFVKTYDGYLITLAIWRVCFGKLKPEHITFSDKTHSLLIPKRLKLYFIDGRDYLFEAYDQSSGDLIGQAHVSLEEAILYLEFALGGKLGIL